LLATGDLVQDQPEGYRHVRRLLGGLRIPVHCIPGNHDTPELAAALSDGPFSVGGHFDRDAWRVVMLDTRVPGRGEGRLAGSELARLDALLAEAGDRPSLVVMHHQPVALGSEWLDGIGLSNADAFLSVLDRHPVVRGVVFGHVHQAVDTSRGRVRFLGTPSTCAQFKPRVPNFEVDTLPPAWRRISLLPDGSIESTVAWLDRTI
ncbi:MAG: hypothetical protein RLZZ200_2147, partial [Pseudomonadota bacterium]